VKSKIYVGCSLTILAFATAAKAESYADPKPVSGWIVTVSAHGGFAPTWDGSKNLSPFLLPGLAMRRPGASVGFSAPDEAPGFALYDNGFLKAGVSGRLRGPRQQASWGELHGVHDIDWTLEAGGFAEFWTFKKLRARAEIRRGFVGHHGTIAELYLDWVEKHGPWTFSIGPRMTIGDMAYTNKLFGVTLQDAWNNGGIPPYAAAGGVKSFGATAALTYDWSQTWSTTAFARYNRLTGSAAASPLVTKLGSPDQLMLGLSVSYSFHTDLF
jgi:MipA family protein